MGESAIIRLIEGIFYVIGWILSKIFRLIFFGAVSVIQKQKNKPVEAYTPNEIRFEHTLIVAGSGHGKTQLIQNQFLDWDLQDVVAGRSSAIFIDSQGDMLRKILRLRELSPPKEDPPPAAVSQIPAAETPNDIGEEKQKPVTLIGHLWRTGFVLLLYSTLLLPALGVEVFADAVHWFGNSRSFSICVAVGCTGLFIGVWLRRKTRVTYVDLCIASAAPFAIFVATSPDTGWIEIFTAYFVTVIPLFSAFALSRKRIEKVPLSVVPQPVDEVIKKPPTLSDRVVLIDPNDIENPPCLNLFDFGLDRLKDYPAVDRERMVNGAIALYEYMFGALLGAEMTNRQGTIFRYLARLMMVVPNPTIYTLMDFMEEPEKVRPYLPKLDIVTQRFFTTQFFTRGFDMTREQILNRLWGVLSNNVLARMFSHTENKLNLFEAMNNGSLILINTAKDLLKQEGCELFGRFMIALISQAVQERAVLPEGKRKPTFFYIDEAADYFDDSIEDLLNTARKYKVGLILATQNLGQFSTKLLATTLASTSSKFAGGVSHADALTLSKEMRCDTEFIEEMAKAPGVTRFAYFVRNQTTMPSELRVALGDMESRPRMSDTDFERLISANRKRYTAPYDPNLLAGSTAITQSGVTFALEETKEL